MRLLGRVKALCEKRSLRPLCLPTRFVQTAIMSQDTIDQLRSLGVNFALASDAAEAVLHLAADKSLNGRSNTFYPL